MRLNHACNPTALTVPKNVVPTVPGLSERVPQSDPNREIKTLNDFNMVSKASPLFVRASGANAARKTVKKTGLHILD